MYVCVLCVKTRAAVRRAEGCAVQAYSNHQVRCVFGVCVFGVCEGGWECGCVHVCMRLGMHIVHLHFSVTQCDWY